MDLDERAEGVFQVGLHHLLQNQGGEEGEVGLEFDEFHFLGVWTGREIFVLLGFFVLLLALGILLHPVLVMKIFCQWEGSHSQRLGEFVVPFKESLREVGGGELLDDCNGFSLFVLVEGRVQFEVSGNGLSVSHIPVESRLGCVDWGVVGELLHLELILIFELSLDLRLQSQDEQEERDGFEHY